MVEPSRASTRRILGGGVAAAIALTGVGFLVGRNTAAPSKTAAVEPSPAPSPTASPVPAPVIPAVIPPLGRADLLDAARVAADAFASGRRPPSDAATLAGRRFQFRLPFGCRGPADAPLGWRYDRDDEALRVSVTPARFDPAAWLGAGAAGVDLIEGFWVDRPWTSSEDCLPAAPTPGDVAPPPDRTLAVVQIHRAGESRIGRRDGEAFEAVEKIAPDALKLSQGLRLRLNGRVVAAPGESDPLICRSPTPAGGRPVCLITVSLDEVTIENPATASALATWAVSSDRVENR